MDNTGVAQEHLRSDALHATTTIHRELNTGIEHGSSWLKDPYPILCTTATPIYSNWTGNEIHFHTWLMLMLNDTTTKKYFITNNATCKYLITKTYMYKLQDIVSYMYLVDGTIVSTHHSDKSLLTVTSEANEDPALNFWDMPGGSFLGISQLAFLMASTQPSTAW